MTIPKNAGLSHLADVSNEQALTFHYPVKKKGQPRQLRPNLDAIRYLEIESETDTEIHSEHDAGETVWEDGACVGFEFKVQRALGYFSACQRSMYPWPMFQVFQVSGFKAKMIGYLSPCPDCDDWSRTSRCTEHHDRDGVAGLKMGDERRRARQRERDRATGRRVVNAYASPNSRLVRDANGNIRVAVDSPERDRQMREQLGLYAQTPCTCSMCQPRPRPTDPGGFRMPELLDLDRVPDELLPGSLITAAALDRLRSLPDGTLTIEVNGETVQGIQSFTINIDEGDARDR